MEPDRHGLTSTTQPKQLGELPELSISTYKMEKTPILQVKGVTKTFCDKFSEQCLRSLGRCLRGKAGIIPYPSPKNNMLLVFVRIGPKPVWD